MRYQPAVRIDGPSGCLFASHGNKHTCTLLAHAHLCLSACMQATRLHMSRILQPEANCKRVRRGEEPLIVPCMMSTCSSSMEQANINAQCLTE